MDNSPPLWRAADGSPIACREKIRVLDENFAELRQVAVDALDDGVLLGCSEVQLHQAMANLVAALTCSFSAAARPSQPPTDRLPEETAGPPGGRR